MDNHHAFAIVCPRYGSQVFEMIMSGLRYELETSLGYPVEIVHAEDGRCTLTNRWILLFCPQHLQNLEETLSSNRVIVYNLEQLIWGRWDDDFKRCLGAHMIWDYSEKNIAYARERFEPHPLHIHVPIGYSDYFRDLVGEPTTPADGRIAFLGNMSDRRSSILARLSGVDVYTNHYYDEVRKIMSTHGTILNLHFHSQPCILEMVRIVPWMCQRKRVISERSCDTAMDAVFEPWIEFVEDENITEILDKPSKLEDEETFRDFQTQFAWSRFLGEAMGRIRFNELVALGGGDIPKVAVATLHCNNRGAIFEVVSSLASSVPDDFKQRFVWIIFSQGCSDEHNDLLEECLEDNGFQHKVVRIPNNMGWSKGMNGLYSQLYFRTRYDFVLHLEDDWICDPSTTKDYPTWFEDCVVYMVLHPHVSTLFLRKYTDAEDKRMYGWTRSIPYLCFKHPNPFNYESKIRTQPKQGFRGLTFRRIPEFLYSANPTIIRLKDYVDRKVLPFPEFDDASNRQGEWKTTTMEDAPQWGYSEGLSMEKIRDLVCMNVNHGFFYHRN